MRLHFANGPTSWPKTARDAPQSCLNLRIDSGTRHQHIAKRLKQTIPSSMGGKLGAALVGVLSTLVDRATACAVVWHPPRNLIQDRRGLCLSRHGQKGRIRPVIANRITMNRT